MDCLHMGQTSTRFVHLPGFDVLVRAHNLVSLQMCDKSTRIHGLGALEPLGGCACCTQRITLEFLVEF